MHPTLAFPDLLRLIDERSAAFRTAVAAAPDLDAIVPTCPEWTLFDLAEHLGQRRPFWAAVVAAGPADAPPAPSAWEAAPPTPRDREALVSWLAASTERLLAALQEAGPDRECWAWWGWSQSPKTSGAIARHQLQEIAVHTYDAEVTLAAATGATRPSLPEDVALDGIDEFQFTCCATTQPWPHEPATVDYHATEGRSWRVTLSADGARVTRLPDADADAGTEPDAGGGSTAPDASARGTASDLVLWFYGRVPTESLALEGDPRVFDQLIEWDPGVP